MAFIELKQVSKQFIQKNQRVDAVNQVDLTIQKGEIFGIVGYSGAGKSTLVRLFNGLEKPTAGKITINGEEIQQLKGKELRKFRKKVGMIFQHFNLLWSRTVEENILLPLELAGVAKEEREERAKELIQLVGLSGKNNTYPAQLSGGQKQRVGIARALANQPDILLVDEGTSALDPQTTDEVLDLLAEVNQRLGVTIIFITHEMHVIRKICQKVAVMESGKVVEFGEVTEVFEHPKQGVTKRFVQQETIPEANLADFSDQYTEGKLVKLTFRGDQARQPILSQVIRKFQIDMSVIQGQIQAMRETSFGTLIVEIIGEEKEMDRALLFLVEQGIGVEVVDHA